MSDISGQKFGRLTVIKRVDSDSKGNSRWLCKCDCGKKNIVLGYCLKRHDTKSCGCLKIQHGHTKGNKKSKTYIAWISIWQRCTNPNNKDYHNYGGRGIKMCKRWNKFENFLEDMGEVPCGCQIDRINNNLGYSPSNCRWTTAKNNNRNRRNNHLETYNGRTQCLAAWADEYKIPYKILWARLYTSHWSVEKALTTKYHARL